MGVGNDYQEYSPRIDSLNVDIPLNNELMAALVARLRGRINPDQPQTLHFDPATVESLVTLMARGGLKDEVLNETILSVQTMVRSPNEAKVRLAEMADYECRQERGILAYFVRGDNLVRENFKPGELETFINRYPNPLNFMGELGAFLDKLGAQEGITKRQQYEISANSFLTRLYGDRWEVAKQAFILKDRAKSYSERFVSKEVWPGIFANLTEEAQDKKSVLEEMNLYPENSNQAKAGGKEYFFSNSFMLDKSGGKGIMAYVKQEDGKFKPVVYYKESNDGVWRVLADTYSDRPDTEVAHNLRRLAPGERDDNMVPIELWSQMEKISAEGTLAMEGVLTDKLWPIIPKRSGLEARSKDVVNVEGIPKDLVANPSAILPNAGKEPNFSLKPESSWGNFTVYKSTDGTLSYVFQEVNQKVRVVAVGETRVSQVDQNGASLTKIDANGLTPPWSLDTSQLQGKEWARDPDMDGSVDMWETYIKNIPMIQAYLRANPNRS